MMLHKILRTCLGIKENESVLIATDEKMLDVAAEIEKAAKKLSTEVITMKMKLRSRHAEEPPHPVAKAMEASDVVIIPTTFSLSHTDARKNACERGARIASMPGITMQMLKRGGMTADYEKVKRNSEAIAKMLTEAKEIKIKTMLGTDFSTSLEGRSGLADTGILREKGVFGNLPAGEGFIAPVEGTSEGVVVFDGSFSSIGVLKKPLKLSVKKGKVVKCPVKKILKYKNAANIAEIGFGANPQAKIIGNVLEDEKVMGTVHIALGDNHTFGGITKSEVHLDGIIKKPSIWLDGEEIMRDGELLWKETAKETNIQ